MILTNESESATFNGTKLTIDGQVSSSHTGSVFGGEFAVAGKEAKVDYDCVIPGNVKSFSRNEFIFLSSEVN